MLECCYLVHSCNRGHWPLWMKFPIFRPSCAGMSGKPTGSRSKSHGLQRASGKMFFQWGEVRKQFGFLHIPHHTATKNLSISFNNLLGN